MRNNTAEALEAALAICDERDAPALNDRRECLDVMGQCALVARGKAEKHSRHVGGSQGRAERIANSCGIRNRRSHEIKPRGRAPRFVPMSLR